jgi:predicted ATPase
VGSRCLRSSASTWPTSSCSSSSTTASTCSRLLATSRERLHLSGEHEFPLAPLAAEEALALFATRATAAQPGFALDGNREQVAEICGRLDGLPLAIKLAAARVRVLSPEALLARLEHRLPLLTGGARDIHERQRTLRATIAWSYDLLEPKEQQLFGRLAVFAGGCTLEAAEQVCEADFERLSALVEKSLIRQRGDRFWMLETIRGPPTEELRRRHAKHSLELAGKAEEGLRSRRGEVARDARGGARQPPRRPRLARW